jgi:MFS family permease
MAGIITPIASLLLSVALLLMGNGLQGVLLPVSASLGGFSDVDIGILGSAYYAGFMVGCLFGPRLVRRAGHIRAFAAMVSIVSSIALAHSLITEPVPWWLLRAGTGLCFAVLYTVIESWLNEKATDENRGLVFSIYTIINLTVITLGQLMLTFAEPGEFELFALASILVSLAAVPVALTRGTAPAPITAVNINLRSLYRLSPVGVGGCLAVGLANGSFWALGPIYALERLGTGSGVAVFMSVAVIAGAVGQWPLGRWSDRTDRRKAIIVACGGASIAGLSLVVLAGTGTGSILAFVFLYGLFAFPIYSLSVAHTNDHMATDELVQAASGLLLVFAFGAIVGPVIASMVVGAIGIQSLFAFTAAIHVAMVAFALYRMRERGPAPEATRTAFADTLKVAQTVSTIDPLSATAPPGPGESRQN